MLCSRSLLKVLKDINCDSDININFNIINPDIARSKILKDLKLIYGIGEVTERVLKSEGYNTIEDLCRHPRFDKIVCPIDTHISCVNLKVRV